MAKLTKLMKEAIGLLEKGHRGWFSWTIKRVECHLYIDVNDPEHVLTDKECVSNEHNCQCKVMHINASTMAGLMRRNLIIPKTVDVVSERFGKQTFHYYTLSGTV